MTRPAKGDLVVIKEIVYWNKEGYVLLDDHPRRHELVGQIFEVDRTDAYNWNNTVMIKTTASPTGEWLIPMEFVEVVYTI